MESARGIREPAERLLVEIVEAVLARTGVGPVTGGPWRLREGDFWCHVSPPGEAGRPQGWKLHVAATPLAAPLVLARAAEILVRHGCRFKFAGTIGRAGDLVSHRYDRGGGGKFLTAYPELDDARLRELAAELHRATLGLPGPAILSDRPCFPGSLVHYRYGVFSGVPALGDDGIRAAMLVAPDGRLVPDRRRAWFAPPEWAPRDPFAQGGSSAAGGRAAPAEVLLDGRFLVRGVIRHAFGGGVFRGVDESTGTPVIIKQARPHTAATLTGRDARDLRRHEAAMLEAFAGSGFTPAPVALFEQQGDLFLVQEAVDGVTLRQWALDRTELGEQWGVPAVDALRRARSLACLMRLVHDEGWVLRDFNPNNVMVTDDGEVCLIDLEMLARPGEPAIRIHTPGYAAPEQVNAPRYGPAPGSAADLYSLGATFFHLVTGVDPLLAADDPGIRGNAGRLAAWLGRIAHGNEAARLLAPLIVALLDDDPARRPGLDEVLDRLAETARATAGPSAAATAAGVIGLAVTEADPAPAAGPRGLAEPELKELVADGIDHLLATADPEAADRLWPSGPVGSATDAFNVQHGAAGVLGVLVRAYEVGEHPAVLDAVRNTATWIADRVGREPRTLPGLYYGRSGTAWALLDAAQLLGDERLLGHAMELAARVPVRWHGPDVCHGVAGAGLTQLRFWEATGERRYLDRAEEAGAELAAMARRRDGRLLWPVPRAILSTPADVVHYGFAHGVAGIGAFLLALARTTGDTAPADLAVEGARTLLAVAEVADGAAYWRSGERGGPRKTHWCSGSSGVGTFLLRVRRETGEDDFLVAARRAAVAVRRSRRHIGTSQCHGLAGDGEFLLDLADVCGEPAYRGWAAELAAGLYARNVVRDGRTLVPDDTGTQVWADYGTGLSGVIAFLLRSARGGPRLWLPRSLTDPDIAQRG
ncbi:class IV lanthionine synthetase LanL [Streptomyces sp. BPTC-684]|uniref:class IV lanthionine synthetase LanL n=1 Tax=Streptomyces sp. BPTC-684 TaxID=3043734 RepID=UPI0024B1434F|nr:class IV lanthionine synthetase LanL [Streptomyces sp. BPTC-684]WHM40231.1 class IV lanthionine synthetase LanL [Streptomyces sp. BPTC-684]